MSKKKKAISSTILGYGHRHVTARKKMLYTLVDGTPCEWCGLPMYKDASQNFDGAELEADHVISLADSGCNVGNLPTRLLHRTCNRKKGSDSDDRNSPLNRVNDDLRDAAALGGSNIFRW